MSSMLGKWSKCGGGKSFVLIHLSHQIELDEPWEVVLGVIRVQAGTKNLRSYFFGRHVGDLNVGIVHQNLPYDTMHKLLAFH